jgi:hypothetical protein
MRKDISQNQAVDANDQLHELSREQAREVLDAFLKTEREAFPDFQFGSIELDFSPRSVELALKHIAAEVETGNLNVEQRDLWFMRLGYYLGESLCHANSKLAWGLGDPEYAFANHPVITGFSNGEEAEVINISRNLVMAVAEGISPPTRIDNGVSFWFEIAKA